MTDIRPFHLALPVTDLPAAEEFYCGLLGCGVGRTASRWIDLNFFGHQVTLHLVDDTDAFAPTNPVDGDSVPARHFGEVGEQATLFMTDPSGNALEFKSFADPTQLFAAEMHPISTA